MSVETPSLFTLVIKEHLELKERNARLEGTMPLTRYKVDDPFENHPLFKTEEQARLEETLGGTEPAIIASEPPRWPGEDSVESLPDQSLIWGRSRDFDWGE